MSVLRRTSVHRMAARSVVLSVLGMSLLSVSAGSTAEAQPVATLRGPAWSTPIGATHLSSPVVADVNGDGVPDVVTADLSGLVHVLDGRTGRDLPGWPQSVQPKAGVTTAVESTPAVADLDRNGHKEIIVGAGSINVPNQPGGLVVFNANGSVRWRMQTFDVANVWTGGPPDGFSDSIVGSPAVGDIDGSGFPSIVFGSFDHRIYALNRFGGNVAGFPFISGDTVWDSPALYDSGHHGRMDIFIGGDASPGGPCGNLSWAGVLRDIRFTGGTPQVVWQHCQHQIYQSSPAIGDLEGNGRMAMVIGTGVGPSQDPVATKTLNAFHLDDGSAVPGWPVTLNGAIFGSPVIGDVTGNGHNDVVVGACAICTTARVWAFRGTGAQLWNVPVGVNTEVLSTPVLADLDGNGINDVAVGVAGAFYLLRGSDGASLYSPIEVNRVMQNSAAVADFGAGAGWRLIVQSWLTSGNGAPENGSGRVDSFPLPAPGTQPDWPQWRLGADHLGAPPAPPPPPAHQGYWLVGSDGGIFSFGNAAFFGSTGAVRLNAPIVAMAATSSGRGYHLLASDGGIFSFGDAGFYGSTGGMHLNATIVAMAPTPSGRGYWLVASDGGIFSFGDAGFYGSTGAIHLNAAVVAMAATASGHGYWLVASDGGIFAFGDAAFHGSTGGIHLNRPIVGVTRSVRGGGYRLVASDGGIFSFGDAPFFGSTGAIHLNQPIKAMADTPTGVGYWLFATDGGVFCFGDAGFYGSTGGMQLNRPIVGAAAGSAS